MCVLHTHTYSHATRNISIPGRVVFHGARDDALRHFAMLGYACPRHTNPAEHLIDLVSIDFENEIIAETDRIRIARFAAVWAGRISGSPSSHAGLARSEVPNSSSAAPAAAETARPARPRRSLLVRLGMLMRRSFRQNVRDWWMNGLRFIVSRCERDALHCWRVRLAPRSARLSQCV